MAVQKSRVSKARISNRLVFDSVVFNRAVTTKVRLKSELILFKKSGKLQEINVSKTPRKFKRRLLKLMRPACRETLSFRRKKYKAYL